MWGHIFIMYDSPACSRPFLGRWVRDSPQAVGRDAVAGWRLMTGGRPAFGAAFIQLLMTYPDYAPATRDEGLVTAVPNNHFGSTIRFKPLWASPNENKTKTT